MATIPFPVLTGLEDLRHRWGWFLAIGIVLIAVGFVALMAIGIATLATAIFLSWLMVVGGIVEIVHAFRIRRWGGFLLYLAVGILGVLVGLLIATHPAAGALAWTLLFASFFTVVGIYRLVAAARLKFPNWGWVAFDGAVTLVLGILLWLSWPSSGFWFLGLAVGISLILRGWSAIMLALALRTAPPAASHLRITCSKCGETTDCTEDDIRLAA
jgi:uncharacterized membrane protein HdeD (DUF308 family)